MAILGNIKDVSELQEKKGEKELGFSEDALKGYHKMFEGGDFFGNLPLEEKDSSQAEEAAEAGEIPQVKEEPGLEASSQAEEAAEAGEIPQVEKVPEPEEAPESDMRGCPIDGNGGSWEGERGNSKWIPDRDEVPKSPLTNPEGLSWGELLDKYGIDGIPFQDGEADFSEVSKGQVEIDDFTDDRAANFDQADEKLAEQRGCTPEEVARWREENKYTWHECKDCKTMQKVPTEIHGNVSHSGGVAEYRKQNS